MPRDPSARGRDPSWPEKPDVASPFVECQFPPTPQPMVGDPSTTTTPCAPLGRRRRRGGVGAARATPVALRARGAEQRHHPVAHHLVHGQGLCTVYRSEITRDPEGADRLGGCCAAPRVPAGCLVPAPCVRPRSSSAGAGRVERLYVSSLFVRASLHATTHTALNPLRRASCPYRCRKASTMCGNVNHGVLIALMAKTTFSSVAGRFF
jgi:hypothetical protein